MWVIIRTLKGKNSFLTESGEWSRDRTEAERFDKFDYAVYCRDKNIALRERRGVVSSNLANARFHPHPAPDRRLQKPRTTKICATGHVLHFTYPHARRN